jgi:hypothetical protein
MLWQFHSYLRQARKYIYLRAQEGIVPNPVRGAGHLINLGHFGPFFPSRTINHPQKWGLIAR